MIRGFILGPLNVFALKKKLLDYSRQLLYNI